MSGAQSILNQPKPVVTLDQKVIDAINAGVEPYPIPDDRKYGYGTAGVSVCSHTTNKS